jgi:hypothetical protein
MTVSPNAQPTFRDAIRTASPGWLRRTQAGGILYAIGLLFDGLADMTAAAIQHRYPGYYSYQTLPRLGRERKLTRGRYETDAAFAARLPGWLDAHKLRGGPGEMLRQLYAYWAGHPDAPFSAVLVNTHGLGFALDVAGNITWGLLTWSLTPRFARWWLFLSGPYTPTIEDWGDGDWGGERTWGTDLTPDEVADVRAIPVEWNARHCRDAEIAFVDATHRLWGYPVDTWGGGGDWGPELTPKITVPIA